ncbi:hypothetical protein D3C78_1580240 [compost metagenome]
MAELDGAITNVPKDRVDHWVQGHHQCHEVFITLTTQIVVLAFRHVTHWVAQRFNQHFEWVWLSP